MGGPWEKYQQQQPQTSGSEGPWAKYQQSSTEGIPADRKNYDLTQVPGAAISNVGESTGGLLSGIGQMIAHPLDTIKGAIDVGAGALQNILPKGVVDFVNKFDSNPEAAAKAVQLANAVGGVYKDRYGSYEDIKRTLAEDPVGAAADISTLLTGGAGAATKLGKVAQIAGAGEKAAAVAEQTANAMRIAGNAVNPLRPVNALAAKAAGIGATGVSKVMNALTPKETAYMQAAEGQAPAILNALRNPVELVPGSMPTAMQAAVPTGVTKFQAFGAKALKQLPTENLARTDAQKAAQLSALQGIAKTPEELQAAIAARSEAANPLYTAARTGEAAVDLTPVKNLIDQTVKENPLNKQLVSELNDIRKGIGDQTAVSSQTAMSLVDDLKNRLGAEGNQYIKGQLNEIKDLTRKSIPGMTEADAKFAEMSKPVDQMRVAQYLQNKLTPALGEETAKLKAESFASAVENAPQTLKASTDLTTFDKLSDVLSPEQMKTIEDITADLARSSRSEQMANAASSSVADMLKPGAPQFPHVMNKIATIANDLLRRFAGKMDQKMAMDVAVEMLDPKKAADALQKAMARQNQIKKTTTKIKQAGMININPAAPQVSNALAKDQQNQNAMRE